MDRSDEISEFLRTRRARVTPEQAGLTPHEGPRRVKGLRREEVAQLAGVSVDYYVRLERGRVKGVSRTVLEAVARALRLDDTERAHLFDLTQPGAPRARRPRSPSPQRIQPAVYRALDAVTAPALIMGRRMDVLAANRLGTAVFGDFQARPYRERNYARFVFLDEAAHTLYPDWNKVAGEVVATLHLYAGRNPGDRQLTDLIGELSVHSDTFRHLWASHDVTAHASGTKRLHHSLVGELTLDYVSLAVGDDAEQSLVILTPEPASASAEALAILASWTTTPATTPQTPEQSHQQHR